MQIQWVQKKEGMCPVTEVGLPYRTSGRDCHHSYPG